MTTHYGTDDGPGHCQARCAYPFPYICTMPPGHEGNHRGHDSVGDVCWEWGADPVVSDHGDP